MAEAYQKIGTSTLLSTMAYDPPVGAVVATPLGLLQTGYAVEDIPTAQNFNSLLQGFGEKINHCLQNGIPLWNATTAYVAGNFVNHTNTGWVCVTGNTNSTPTTANANWKQVTTGINTNEDVVFNGVLTANGGFLASQGGKPFSYESIPKPVQTPTNFFEIKINGNIQATLFSPTAVAVPYFKQFTGSNLTIVTTSVGVANGIDATRVSGQMYYLWLIGKNDGTLAGLFSASNTAPTMPTGYTWRRLLPWACATYPPNATYQNGGDTVTDITSSGREGAFIEHLVGNWERDGGNNPVITYVSRFPSTLNNNGTNAPTLVSKAKPYNTSFYIENLACMNVSLSGQPMWLVPPEAEAVGLQIKGNGNSQMLIGVETFNGSGLYTVESYPVATSSSDTMQTPLFPITSRRMRFANNVTIAHVGVREFRCNFTNFWV